MLYLLLQRGMLETEQFHGNQNKEPHLRKSGWLVLEQKFKTS